MIKINSPIPLERSHDRSAFNCGSLALNIFFKKYALQNQKKDTGRTFVASIKKRIVGYYTLVAGSVSKEDVPSVVKKGLGHYSIPVIILARLAVDLEFQNQGIGSDLLKDALLRIIQASNVVGARAVLIHAKDERAKAFYSRYGFVPSPTDPLHLYLTMMQIKNSL